MQSSIKTKVLVMCIFLVFITTVSVSMTFYTLTKQYTHRKSRQNIQIGFDILLEGFAEQRQRYTDRVGEFLRRSAQLGGQLYLYNQEAPQDPMRAIGVYLIKTAGEIREFGQILEPDRLLLYGLDRELQVVYYRQDGQQGVGAYVPLDEGRKTYLPMDDFALQGRLLAGAHVVQDLPFPVPVPTYYDGEMPDEVTETLLRDGTYIGFRVAAPIYNLAEPVGILVADVHYGQELVERYAALSKTDMNLFAGTMFGVGTLPEQTLLNSVPMDELISCDTVLEQTDAFRMLSLQFANHSYYQGQCALSRNEQVFGGISVSLSKAIEEQEIRKILTSVFTIAALVIAGSLILVSAVLVPRLTGPITNLTRVSLQMAKGDLDQRIDTGGTDELGILARGFAHMRDEVKRRIDELQQFNDELEDRVKRRTAEITRQKYVLDTFMANVPDSIYFKDRDSRITKANRSLAHLFGVEAPEHLIGKSDFDFFPEPEARVKYAQEQEILHSGIPMLSVEEPDAGGRWALTTKMPLRDEHGDIIGTFGISRDITDLKLSQQQLEDAYGEISNLNDQLKEENLRMGAELNVARRLQEMILPPPEELRQFQQLEIVGYMKPADEVGGDYYDVITCRQDHVCIGIGDVTGHGLESGVLMLMTQTAIRTLIEHGESDPVIFLNTLNRVLFHNIQRMRVEKTLTLALARYHDRQISLIGQHEEMLVVRQGGQVERIDTLDLGFPVGMVEDIAEWVHETTVSLNPGDAVVLYSDGVTEAENSAQQQYGIERLCAILSRNWQKSPEMLKQAVIDDVMRHIGSHKIYDDLTLVVLRQN